MVSWGASHEAREAVSGADLSHASGKEIAQFFLILQRLTEPFGSSASINRMLVANPNTPFSFKAPHTCQMPARPARRRCAGAGCESPVLDRS